MFSVRATQGPGGSPVEEHINSLTSTNDDIPTVDMSFMRLQLPHSIEFVLPIKKATFLIMTPFSQTLLVVSTVSRPEDSGCLDGGALKSTLAF
jgi:hypothetical protein